MNRRQMLAGLASSAALTDFESRAANMNNAYLELIVWRFHNSEENQASRTSEFLQNGLQPALSRAGARLIGAFSNVIATDGPYYVTLSQYASLASLQEVREKLASDEAYQQAVQKLSSGPGLPFVRVESSLVRCFDGMPQPAVSADGHRIFEWRTYESQSFATLARKIGMFNHGEMQIFERLGMRPVFFGETIVGPKQPNVTYMLSYDDLAAREKLWRAFGSDPEWQKLRSHPELADAQIVANISNVILQPLKFSSIR